MSVPMPVCIAGLITPWNFPMAIPSWKMMPALVLGNTVVIKPATDTPLSVVNLVSALGEAGLPSGVVNVVTGGGIEAGAPLTSHQDAGVVSFTGSTRGGRKGPEACAPALTHCHLEMGGKDIIMGLDGAGLDRGVEGGVWGGFGTTGQRCTAASRVAVDKRVYREFTEAFVARARALRVGNGLDPRTEMGPCVNENQLKTVERYVGVGREEGAKLLCGGHRLSGGEYEGGYFYEPTVFGDCSPRMRVSGEEIFGPVVSVIPVDSLEEAIAVGNSVEDGLSTSLSPHAINKSLT